MKWMMLFLINIFEQAHAARSNFMPPQATEIAQQYDSLYSFLLWVSFVACAILIGGMIYFVVKYRRRTANDKTAYISHNTFLEFLWSFIPLVFFLAMFGWGWYVYQEMRTMPENALEVHIFGKQWQWDFAYKSGKTSSGEFYVPVNTPVKLIITSRDVLHSFYIPSMRIKQDAVPGRYTALSFNAEKLGDFQIFCAEFCGTAHSAMLAKMHVVSQDEYEKWLQENDEGLSLAQKGQKLYNSKGCVACHSIDGTTKVGPSWKGLFGTKQELVAGGAVTADENFIHNFILNPNAKPVKGFPVGVMPTFQGQLTEDELTALIEFIKTLK
jgi:cytochrome c oxidase subunit 2